MSELVNSSDEAVEAAVDAVYAFYPDPDVYGHSHQMYERDMRIGIEAAWPVIAAAVRADCEAEMESRVAQAVADERPNWAELLYELDNWAPSDSMLDYSTDLPNGVEFWRRIRSWYDRFSVAAGSVPGINQNQDSGDGVATPEPTPQPRRDLIVCSHCLLTPAEIDATDHHSGGWCPGPVATPEPVTCEHGQSASHYTTVISGLCPGPVSVPKESSE